MNRSKVFPVDQRQPEIYSAINAGRLLVITPFKNEIKRVTAATAEQRNRFMIDIADEVVVGYAVSGGMLKRVIMEFKEKKDSRIQI